MCRACFIIAILASLFLVTLNAYSGGMASSVYVTASPDTIIADGASITTITAEVRDSSGAAVPDGTSVSFSTNQGTIQASADTVSGVARVRLTSGTEVGTATISAWVTQGGAVGQVKVELLAPGTKISRESFLNISAGYLIFDGTSNVIYAEDKVKITHRGLTIIADVAEINVQDGTVRCKRSLRGDAIKLSRGSTVVNANLLYYKMSDMRGKLLSEGESGKVERLNLRGTDLSVSPDEDEYTPPNLYDFADITDSPYIIKATSITIRPGRDIQFRRARVYIDGKKVLSVPLHVIPMNNNPAQKSRYLGWGTNGLRVDVPFYYSLSPTSTGSVHLRRGQQAGWGYYSGNNGFSLDLVQDYATTSGAEGSFVLDRLTGDWGAHWQHNQTFGTDGRLYSYLDFPSHKDLFGMVSINKPLSKCSLGVNLYGNKYKGMPGAASTDVYVQSLPKPILGGLANYTLLAKTSYAGGGGSSYKGFGTGLQTQVSAKPTTIGKDINWNNSVSFGHDWGGVRPGFTMLGSSTLSKMFGQLGMVSLGYSYIGDTALPGTVGRHRLSATIAYSPTEKWQFRAFSSYTLDQSLSSSFADATYRFLPKWRLNILQTLQRYEQYNYSDTEIVLGREIGDNEVMLVWSKSRNKLSVEFNAASF